MKTIHVDLDVFKRLTNLLETTEDTYSAVIRRLLQPTNVRSAIWSVAATTPALNSQGPGTDNDISRSEANVGSAIRSVFATTPSLNSQGSVASVEISRSETDNVVPSDFPAIVKNAIARLETFPKGTELRARYKGQEYVAYVIDGRTLALNENQYSSLSEAAMAITHGPVSGYAFWKIHDPTTQRWIRLSEYRKAKSTPTN